jgi:hypothetical protein
MTDLFIKRGATYSADQALRWTLTREWGDGKSACFLGHNPSTAGHELEDPTTLTWNHFAKLWGCGRYTAANLYPYRSPDPDVARQWAAWDKTRDWTVRDLLMENESVVVREAKRADIFVACYGAIALTADAKLLADRIEREGLCGLCDPAPLRSDVDLIVDALRRYVHTPMSRIPLIKEFRDQRDECADVLREIMAKLRSESGSEDPMEPFAYDASWEALAKKADTVLAQVPTYSVRLDRICKEVGVTREQLEGALAALATPPSISPWQRRKRNFRRTSS